MELDEGMTREERERIIAESLAETRAQGLEPSQRSKDLSQLWVDGLISFSYMAQGIALEAFKEEEYKRRRNG